MVVLLIWLAEASSACSSSNESQIALQGCAFCAIDLEMTGLFVDGVREEFLDDVQDR
jgi:hypothetical protein